MFVTRSGYILAEARDDILAEARDDKLAEATLGAGMAHLLFIVDLPIDHTNKYNTSRLSQKHQLCLVVLLLEYRNTT